MSEPKTYQQLEEELNATAHGVTLDGLDRYKNAVSSFKAQIAELVKEGTITEQTAAKLFLDIEYAFFAQLVKIEY